MIHKVCKKHGRTRYFARKEGWYRCSKCSAEAVTQNRRRKKERLVKEFGGRCSLCGYQKYVGALDFHHVNPKDKSFGLSMRGLCYSWESVLKEAKKCVLVCKNCHAEIEAGIEKI